MGWLIFAQRKRGSLRVSSTYRGRHSEFFRVSSTYREIGSMPLPKVCNFKILLQQQQQQQPLLQLRLNFDGRSHIWPFGVICACM
eukprot:scaffold2612_cov267-Chaetoceros_neogracile.AAC.83